MRRRLVPIIALALAATGAGPAAGTALAAPGNGDTLTYTFTDCVGPAGSPTAFEAVKQPGGAAALHLLDGSAVFVAMSAVDVETGDTLFSTPGFAVNGLPTLTCLSVHPVLQRLHLVTGLLASRR
jgi:hypothetical protein